LSYPTYEEVKAAHTLAEVMKFSPHAQEARENAREILRLYESVDAVVERHVAAQRRVEAFAADTTNKKD
jgi:hypothetical protein